VLKYSEAERLGQQPKRDGGISMVRPAPWAKEEAAPDSAAVERAGTASPGNSVDLQNVE